MASAGLHDARKQCVAKRLDVCQYVEDVLPQLFSGVTCYAPLLPWNWSALPLKRFVTNYWIAERDSRGEQNRTARRQPQHH